LNRVACGHRSSKDLGVSQPAWRDHRKRQTIIPDRRKIESSEKATPPSDRPVTCLEDTERLVFHRKATDRRTLLLSKKVMVKWNQRIEALEGKNAKRHMQCKKNKKYARNIRRIYSRNTGLRLRLRYFGLHLWLETGGERMCKCGHSY
jgi:hypothetical protein